MTQVSNDAIHQNDRDAEPSLTSRDTRRCPTATELHPMGAPARADSATGSGAAGRSRALRARAAQPARGPRRHHRLLRRGQVDRDGRVRGRRLLLRRQPAAGDDPLARRAVHAPGLEGRARRGRVRRPRRRVLRGASRGARRAGGAADVAHRVLFLEADEQTLLNRYKETRRRHPLAPDRHGAGGHRGASARCSSPLRERADLVHRHDRAERGDAAPQDRRRAAADARPPAGSP